jgi:hypothetical protein
MYFPRWLSWTNLGAFFTSLAAWIGLYLSVRHELSQRIILKFSLRLSAVEAGDDEIPTVTFNGSPLVEAIEVPVTNNGLRPVTIRTCRCLYSCVTRAGSTERINTEGRIDKKIGQGEACTGHAKVYSRPSEILVISVTDSTGREWRASRREIAEFCEAASARWIRLKASKQLAHAATSIKI